MARFWAARCEADPFSAILLAQSVRLSGVLTMVCYAITLARTAPERTPARIRIPSYAVWETVVFGLNILAFIFIGLRIRPIFESLDVKDRVRYIIVAVAVLLTVMVVRVVWHMSFHTAIKMARPPARISSAPADAPTDRWERLDHEPAKPVDPTVCPDF